MRTGFVYSIFAMLVLGLTLSLMLTGLEAQSTTSVGEKLRVDEVSYFLDSLLGDLDRATAIIHRRALNAVTNEVITTGVYVDDAEPLFEEAFMNGTVDGSFSPIMNDSTIKDWTEALQDRASDSDYVLTLNVARISSGVADPLHLDINTTYHLNLSDPVSRSRFDRVETIEKHTAITDIEDPIAAVESQGQYSNAYRNCSTAAPATETGTGGKWFYQDPKNWTSGATVTRPGNTDVSGVADKDEKIVVVDDLCSYSDFSPFTQFNGVVSEAVAIDNAVPNSQVDVCGQDDVNLNAVIDQATGALTTDNMSMAVMTDEQMWQNNIQTWTTAGCYFTDPWGPSFWGRLEGRFEHGPAYSSGIAFFVTVPELPPSLQETDESVVGYSYFNESINLGAAHKIKGVTNEDMPWFRLDQDHIDHWNINDLSYD